MKLLRKIILFASGALALVNLAGLLLHLATFHLAGALWSLLRAAGWGAVCVYMIRLERSAAASSSGKP
jgi:hypothetical protein